MTRNSCKFILVLLASAAPLTAALANAQQESTASSGRFVLSGSNVHSEAQVARNDGTFIGDREAQAQLDALLANRDAAKTARQSVKTAENSTGAQPKVDGLGAVEGPASSVAAGDNRERTWILAVAAAGLAASLAATAYLAWSRLRPSNTAVTAFMPQSTRKPATVPMADKDIRPKRRAA